MKYLRFFLIAICYCLISWFIADAQPEKNNTSQRPRASKPKPVVSAVKIVKVSEETRLNTIAESSVEATGNNRFVIIALEFKPSKDPIAAGDFLLLGSPEQEFRCAGLGDGRGAGRYCLDSHLELTRRVWQDQQYFDGLCVERNGSEMAGGTFSTNKPVVIFVVPNTVPIRGLVLRYKGGSLPLVSTKQFRKAPSNENRSSKRQGRFV